jgi:hypothetical protein
MMMASVSYRTQNKNVISIQIFYMSARRHRNRRVLFYVYDIKL